MQGAGKVTYCCTYSSCKPFTWDYSNCLNVITRIVSIHHINNLEATRTMLWKHYPDIRGLWWHNPLMQVAGMIMLIVNNLEATRTMLWKHYPDIRGLWWHNPLMQVAGIIMLIVFVSIYDTMVSSISFPWTVIPTI